VSPLTLTSLLYKDVARHGLGDEAQPDLVKPDQLDYSPFLCLGCSRLSCMLEQAGNNIKSIK